MFESSRTTGGYPPVVLFAAVVTERAGWTWLSLTGECDLSTVAEFRRELHRAVRTGHPVVVDLSGLSMIDSLGIGLLIGAARRAPQLVVLVPPTGPVRELFEATRVSEILEVRTEPPDPQR
jgi:anti-anti-sigma factor